MNSDEKYHFTARIGEDEVSISSFSSVIPEGAIGVTVGEPEEHSFKSRDKDKNDVLDENGDPVMITIKRAKFKGWMFGDKLTQDELLTKQGEIRDATHLKAFNTTWLRRV